MGQRIKIAYTRALVSAALSGALDAVHGIPDPIFGVAVPVTFPGVPSEVLSPRNTWVDNAAYDAQVRNLATMFAENSKAFADQVLPDVRAAGSCAADMVLERV